MIGDYSSYLEFIGAVYFTMSLDDILKKKVWSPQDEGRLKKAIDGFNVHKDNALKDAIVHANKAKGDELQSELSKKSVFGLFIVAALLLACGYEASIQDSVVKLSILHLSTLYTSCILTLFFLFGGMLIAFKKWKYTVIVIAITFILFFIVYHFRLVFGQSVVERIGLEYIGLFISCLVTLPILWQLVITWMYKSIFYGYIKGKIQKANEEFKQVTSNIERGNINGIPQVYQKIMVNQTMSHKEGTTQQLLDDSLTEYKGILYAEIKSIGENVRLYKLLCSWIAFRYNNFMLWLRSPLKKKISKFKNSDIIDVEDLSTHATKFKQMQSQKKISLRGYCELTGIDQRQFIQYLKNHK